jgi:Flp pilus assembly pilin Flp
MQPHHAEQQSFALSNSNHSEGWNLMVTLSMVLQSSFAYILDTLKRDEGQDFAEYAIILALVVIVAAAGFSGLGTAVLGVVGNVSGQLTAAI